MGLQLLEVDRCPHCNTAKPLLVSKYLGPSSQNDGHTVVVWGAYECSTCCSLVTARTTVSAQWLSNLTPFMAQQKPPAAAIYPSAETIDEDLPESPLRFLKQAVQAIHAPDGAVMLAGSAVDAMLKLKGYATGSVYERINLAVKDGVLTINMSEWAHAVRLESNKPRHADLMEPHATTEVAQQTIDFAKALGQFLFVLPARIERGKSKSVAAVAAAAPIKLLPSDASH